MKPPGRIPSLDGLRALSITMVVVGHAFATFHPARSQPPSYPWQVLGQGPRGVSIFFVISGFLITTLLLQERERTGRISLKKFYERRALRILPAFYAFLATIAVLAWGLHGIEVASTSFAAAATFTWNYARVPGSWWLGHVWSLCIEEQFYLTWPFLLAWAGPRRAAIVAGLVILLSPLVRIASYFALPGSRPYIGIMLHTRADMLMFGCFTALLATTDRGRATLDRLLRHAWLPWVLFGLAYGLGPALEGRYHGAYELTVGYTLEGLAIALLMLWLIRNADSLVGRAMNWRPVVALGVLSYSLYLWQQLFCTELNHTVLGRPGINVAAALAAATLSYWLIEKPFLRLKRRVGAVPTPPS